MMPVLGTITVGAPVLMDEDFEMCVIVTSEMPVTADYFGLRAKGDSMMDKHIVLGDVVVHKQQTGDNGDKVVAPFGDELGVKKLALSFSCRTTPLDKQPRDKAARAARQPVTLGRVNLAEEQLLRGPFIMRCR